MVKCKVRNYKEIVVLYDGRGKDIVESKGVEDDLESEGSRM